MKIKECITGVIVIAMAGIFLFNRKNDSSNEQKEIIAEEEAKVITEDEALEYMDKCLENSFKYSNLVRYEDEYKGENYTFQAKVSQVMENGDLRVYDDSEGTGFYMDNEYYIVDRRNLDTTKIIVDDIITIYGEYAGLVGLTRAINDSTEYVPGFYMYLCDIEDINPDEDDIYNEGYENYWEEEEYWDN